MAPRVVSRPVTTSPSHHGVSPRAPRAWHGACCGLCGSTCSSARMLAPVDQEYETATVLAPTRTRASHIANVLFSQSQPCATLPRHVAAVTPPLQVCLWELYRRRRCPITTADRERMAALSTRGARAHTFQRTASADAWLLTDRGTRLVGQLVTGAARPFPSHPLALRAQVWAHQHRWPGSVAGTRSG